jgi:hypothetical protein
MDKSMDTVELEDKIHQFIKTRGGGVTYVELSNIEGFKGDYQIGDEEHNIWFWHSVSLEAAKAINKLVLEGKIVRKESMLLVYAYEGQILNMPIAKKVRTYKKPHWLPIVFWTPEQLPKN